MKHTQYIFLLFVLVVSCSDSHNNTVIQNNIVSTKTDNNLKVKEIDTILSRNYYLSKVLIKDSILTIKMETPFEDFYSPDRVPILREFSIIQIKDYLNDIRGIVFINYLKVDSTKDDKVYFERKEFLELITFNTSNKRIFDFKMYILNNIDHNKTSKFNGFLDALNKIDNETIIVKDYITLILKFENECEKKENKYKEILIKLKSMILENKDLWQDYDPQDIDYFLDYCNTSKSK